MALKLSYLYQKTPGGPWYYRRKIPKHARSLYPGNPTEVRVALKTKDVVQATKKAEKLASQDDLRWSRMAPDGFGRFPPHDPAIRSAAIRLLETLKVTPGYGYVINRTYDVIPTDEVFNYLERKYGMARVEDAREHGFDEFLNSIDPVDAEAHRLFWTDPDADAKRPPLLSEALEIYLMEHRRGSDEEFRRIAMREVNNAVSVLGDKPVTDITRDDAKRYRDHLVSRMKTASVRRRMNTVSAVINRAIVEKGLVYKNPFAKLSIQGLHEDSVERPPFTNDELETIAFQCTILNDDIRHIVGLMIDLGCRIAEAVGLKIADIDLTADTPFVHFKRHQGRSLKTDNSERKVPLVGMSLWAARQAIAASKDHNSEYLFPRYFDAALGKVKGTHASNTVNKWLRSITGTEKTSHSFRHSMRDRLRDAGVAQEMQEVIGGWASRTVGQQYGAGYKLKLLKEALEMVAINTCNPTI
jgi:integrase